MIGATNARIIRYQLVHHCKGKENSEQKQRQWRDKFRPLTMDITPRQLAGMPKQQWQGPPNFAIEVQHPV
jgi:hypothetical protein